MDIKETIKSAMKQLLGNKGRTFLTMLGMFIGVGSVIMILGLGTGFKEYVKSEFAGLGLGVFEVDVKDTKTENLITSDDIEVIKSLEEVEQVIRAIGMGGTLINTKSEEFDIRVLGGEPGYTTDIQDLELRNGRQLSEKDEQASSQVILIADVVGKAYFGNIDYNEMIGENIQITVNNQPTNFQIVGIYKTENDTNVTQKELEANYERRYFYIPFATLNSLTGLGEGVTSIAGIIKDDYDANSTVTKIGQILNRRHHLKDGYTIFTMTQILDTVESVMSVVTGFISALASISLIVGGVGIMNIMLITVKERTREIGVRKALGASNKVILKQFMIEALMLTVIAGIIGMMIGYMGAIVVGASFNIEAKFTIGMILFSTITSVSIGVIFGVYPAYQAAKLDPIEALRAE